MCLLALRITNSLATSTLFELKISVNLVTTVTTNGRTVHDHLRLMFVPQHLPLGVSQLMTLFGPAVTSMVV